MRVAGRFSITSATDIRDAVRTITYYCKASITGIPNSLNPATGSEYVTETKQVTGAEYATGTKQVTGAEYASGSESALA